MRRCFAIALLLILVAQSSGGVAVAGTVTIPGIAAAVEGVGAALRSMVALNAVPGRSSRPLVPLVRHTPVPRRATANYRDHRRFARLIRKEHGRFRLKHIARPIDLVKLRRAHHAERQLERRTVALRRLPGRRGVRRMTGLPTPTTGVWPWWTYEARSIPGVGQAMANVSNFNFLIEANDVDIPEGGVDLAFRRMYNSQSLHDANNDDNSTYGLYGNRWTNTLDVHLGWESTGQYQGIVSVYTADGARDDYECTTNVVATCTNETPGNYDMMGTVQTSDGICEIQWTKTNGTSYMFNAPYSVCGNEAGEYGLLLAIYGRNTNFYVQLNYSWLNGDAGSGEDLTQIVAIHFPDRNQLALNFGTISGTGITELQSITLPDSTEANPQTVDYQYDSEGDLIGVDKPGNHPVLVDTTKGLPSEYANGAPIPTGNMPELYDYQQGPGILEVCGPRAAITILNNDASGPDADGACVEFGYNPSNQLSSWWTQGVLNPTPQDNVISSPIQSGPSTGWQQWNDTSFFDGVDFGNCSGVTEFSDAYNHVSEWCFNSNGNVLETSDAVDGPNGSEWLDTENGWDSTNDLVSTTDVRGNTTNMAYDGTGNVLEVSRPSETISVGGMPEQISPTSLYDYDSYHNVIHYCDPANNPDNAWNPSPGPTPCAGSGSQNYTQLTYSSDPGQTYDSSEPYGCLNQTQTPLGYKVNITYGNACGSGLPTTVEAASQIPQLDQSERQPEQTFTYYSNGLLEYYSNYPSQNVEWTLNYTSGGMNRLSSRTDPDGVTAYWCYNLDGSIMYTESAYQNSLDNGSCPTHSQLISGNAAPPPYAIAYGYDADGDVATETHHHNCVYGANCYAKDGLTSWCTPSVTIARDSSCKYYDGLDRLVEVKQPYDKQTGGTVLNELYANPWLTRYLYDLTDGTYSFAGSSSFSAYGNLFETEELLPSGGWASETQPNGTPAPNPTYVPIKATAYDGIDRAIAKYSLVAATPGPGDNLSTETLVWDTSPLDPSGVAGLLGQDCNGAGQCQNFDYQPDGELKTMKCGDGSCAAQGYLYDPDDRPAQITSGWYQNPQTYTYDHNGRLSTSSEANDPNLTTSPSTITHDYYADGRLKAVDVSSSSDGTSLLVQSQLRGFSYRQDGVVQTDAISYTAGGISPTVTYDYTNGGRITYRYENGNEKQHYYYNTSGPDDMFLNEEYLKPTGVTLQNYSYSVDSELMGVSSAGGSEQCGAAETNKYSLRGELVGWSNCTPTWGGQGGAFMGNGVSLEVPLGDNIGTWDGNMAVMTELQNVTSGGTTTSTWGFDQAGRMSGESVTPPSGGGGPGSLNRTIHYDAMNRTINPFSASVSCSGDAPTYNWGPNGRPITIVTYDSSCTKYTETLHWDGNQLLFSTRAKIDGTKVLDDIKIDNQGDITPQDTGYQGLTFYDRGPGGVAMGCHNNIAEVFNGFGPDWGWTPANGKYFLWGTPCQAPFAVGGTAHMPTSIDWYDTPLEGDNTDFGAPIGQGGILGMPRTDGLTTGSDTIQGVRSYDSNAGVWTAPDSDPGFVDDPASQKSYMWNLNNPLSYADSTGYAPEFYDAESSTLWPEPDTGPPPDEPETLASDACAAKDAAGNCYASNSEVVMPGANQDRYGSLDEASNAAQQAYKGFTPQGNYEIGCAVYCDSPGHCGYGNLQIGGDLNVGIDLSPYQADATFGVSIWHEHPAGSDDSSTAGHNRDNNKARRLYPWLKGHKFDIFTTYGNWNHVQEYSGIVPEDPAFNVLPIPVPGGRLNP